jgi:hypothetical protein
LFQRQRDLCGRPEFQALPAFGAVGLRQLGAHVRLGMSRVADFFLRKKFGSMDCDFMVTFSGDLEGNLMGFFMVMLHR